jgi:hypothetical protein
MAHKFLSILALAASLGLAIPLALPIAAEAHMVPAPCDFVTAGGFVFKDDGDMANFGAHGGCKNGKFWGNVNYVDHTNQFDLNASRISGYLWDPADPNGRDICGFARINDQKQEVMFRVHLVDNGEPGTHDLFGIRIDNWYAPERFYTVTSRELADGNGGGGNVQLHKSNPSTTAGTGFFQLEEWQMCGDLTTP